MPRVTLLTNVFNESWLLPFWLLHHKDMFDHAIIIDYHSTDDSMDIVRQICPTWEIRTTRNKFFDAKLIDLEFMTIERDLEGYCIILNTTEFLVSERPLQELLPTGAPPRSFEITSWSPYRQSEYDPQTLKEFMSGFELASPKFRSPRYIHSFPTGRYSLGRHTTKNHSESLEGIWLLWAGHYPICPSMWARKLQIDAKRSPYDKAHALGHQHGLTQQGMEAQRDDLLVPTCEELEKTQPKLFAVLRAI